MRLLVDTHALIWAMDEPQRLSIAVAAAIPDPANERLLSAATVWEVAIKRRLGKLDAPADFLAQLERAAVELVPINFTLYVPLKL